MRSEPMPSSRQSRISALPAHLQERLSRRLAGQAEHYEEIPRAERNGRLPLSFSQQRLWFLNEFQPGTAEYNSALCLRLLGSLDISALTNALQRLLARHESLRTTFDEVEGRAAQIVHPAEALSVPVIDLGSPASQGSDTLDRILSDEYSRPFDLRRGPLFRVLLIRRAHDEHMLLLSAHHIIVDEIGR